MEALFTDIAIGGSTATAILTLIDWFMTDKQKESLSSLSVRLWNWLDDTQRSRFLVQFNKGRPQFLLVIASQLFAWTMYLFLLPQVDVIQSMTPREIVVFLLFNLGATFLVVRLFLGSLSKSRNQVTYLGNIVLLTAVLFAILELGAHIRTSTNELAHSVLFALLFFSVVVLPVATLYLLLLLSAVAIIGLYLAKILVRGAELTMRLVAESPKGPLLAISALVGGIAAVAKAFQ